MESVIIALGSNIEPKSKYLQAGLELMGQLDYLTIKKISQVYQTVPKGYDDQDDFYNMVAEVSVDADSSRLINDLLDIELKLHRKRQIKNGPRTLDLDVILMDDIQSDWEELIVPHPRMHERGFVLVPLTEIRPDFVVPGFAGQTVQDLCNNLPQAERDDVEVVSSLEDLVGEEDTHVWVKDRDFRR